MDILQLLVLLHYVIFPRFILMVNHFAGHRPV